MAHDSLIAGLGFFLGTANSEVARYEIQVGFGASSSEVSVGGGRGFAFTKSFGYYLFPIGIRCPAGTRVSARLYKLSPTTNTAWTVGLMYYDDVVFAQSNPGGKGQQGNKKGGGGGANVFVPGGTQVLSIGNAGVNIEGI